MTKYTIEYSEVGDFTNNVYLLYFTIEAETEDQATEIFYKQHPNGVVLNVQS